MMRPTVNREYAFSKVGIVFLSIVGVTDDGREEAATLGKPVIYDCIV